jgi:hypothetical protein
MDTKETLTLAALEPGYFEAPSVAAPTAERRPCIDG